MGVGIDTSRVYNRKTPPGGKVSDVFSFSGQASDASKPAPPRVNRQRSSIDLGGEQQDTNKTVDRQNSEPACKPSSATENPKSQEQEAVVSTSEANKSENHSKVDSNGVTDGEKPKSEPASVRTPDTKQPDPKPAPASVDKISPVPDSADVKPPSTVPDSVPGSTKPQSTVPDSTKTSSTVPDGPKPQSPVSEPVPAQDPAPVKNQETQGDAPPPVVRQNSRRVPPGGHTSGGFW